MRLVWGPALRGCLLAGGWFAGLALHFAGRWWCVVERQAVLGVAHGCRPSGVLPVLRPNTGRCVRMSISGTQMFISSVANAMPSG